MAAITAIPEGASAPVSRAGFLLFALAVGLLWLVAFEGGPVSHAVGQAGTFFHELFHDGRHLIGVPCH
jgi:Probable cobalt transporter subunit (CbtB)